MTRDSNSVIYIIVPLLLLVLMSACVTQGGFKDETTPDIAYSVEGANERAYEEKRLFIIGENQEPVIRIIGVDEESGVAECRVEYADEPYVRTEDRSYDWICEQKECEVEVPVEYGGGEHEICLKSMIECKLEEGVKLPLGKMRLYLECSNNYMLQSPITSDFEYEFFYIEIDDEPPEFTRVSVKGEEKGTEYTLENPVKAGSVLVEFRISEELEPKGERDEDPKLWVTINGNPASLMRYYRAGTDPESLRDYYVAVFKYMVTEDDDESAGGEKEEALISIIGMDLAGNTGTYSGGDIFRIDKYAFLDDHNLHVQRRYLEGAIDPCSVSWDGRDVHVCDAETVAKDILLKADKLLSEEVVEGEIVSTYAIGEDEVNHPVLDEVFRSLGLGTLGIVMGGAPQEDIPCCSLIFGDDDKMDCGVYEVKLSAHYREMPTGEPSHLKDIHAEVKKLDEGPWCRGDSPHYFIGVANRDAGLPLVKDGRTYAFDGEYETGNAVFLNTLKELGYLDEVFDTDNVELWRGLQDTRFKDVVIQYHDCNACLAEKCGIEYWGSCQLLTVPGEGTVEEDAFIVGGLANGIAGYYTIEDESGRKLVKMGLLYDKDAVSEEQVDAYREEFLERLARYWLDGETGYFNGNEKQIYSPGWYKGDLHVHSSVNNWCRERLVPSLKIARDLEELRGGAEGAGLSWFTATDHSYCLEVDEEEGEESEDSQKDDNWEELTRLSDVINAESKGAFVIINDEEVSVNEPANVKDREPVCLELGGGWEVMHIGAHFIDGYTEGAVCHKEHQRDGLGMIDELRSRGQYPIINHPFDDFWDAQIVKDDYFRDWEGVGIEAWNGKFSEGDEMSLEYWEENILKERLRGYIYAGSDTHNEIEKFTEGNLAKLKTWLRGKTIGLIEETEWWKEHVGEQPEITKETLGKRRPDFVFNDCYLKQLSEEGIKEAVMSGRCTMSNEVELHIYVSKGGVTYYQGDEVPVEYHDKDVIVKVEIRGEGRTLAQEDVDRGLKLYVAEIAYDDTSRPIGQRDYFREKEGDIDTFLGGHYDSEFLPDGGYVYYFKLEEVMAAGYYFRAEYYEELPGHEHDHRAFTNPIWLKTKQYGPLEG
jgi:hypothetical protein